MTLPQPPYYARRTRFRQAELAGQAFSPALLDSELDSLLQSVNQSIMALRQIIDASGRLRLPQPLREMSEIEVLTYVATAAQTQFYVAPVTDVLTDRAEVRVNTANDLYAPVDQTKVSLAAAVPSGTVSATLGSNVYTFSATLPPVVVNARLVVNGTDAGKVTSRVDGTHVQTDTPWALANITGTTFTWQYLAVATLTGVTPALAAGHKVQIALFTDGAGALSQLGTAGAATGARLVAVADVGDLLDALNVEDALQEVAGQISTLLSDLGPLADYIRADGTVPMTASLDGGANTGVNFAPGTSNGQLVVWEQISALVALWNDLQQYYYKRDGSVGMTGDVPMGQHRAVDAAAGVDPNDYTIKSQLDERIHKDGSVAMQADLDFNGHRGTGGADATEQQDFVTLKQLLAQSGGAAIAEWRSAGSNNIVVPTGVSRASVEMWGGGGGGHSAAGATAGGGGGGFVQAILPVVAGEALVIEVGAAGVAGAAGGATRIKSGTDVLLEATGGNPGTLSGTIHTGGLGGGGSSPVFRPGSSLSVITGGSGHWPTSTTPDSAQFNGQGGAAPRGGAGGVGLGSAGTYSAPALAAVAPGGAGAGNQAGAAGGVIIRWS